MPTPCKLRCPIHATPFNSILINFRKEKVKETVVTYTAKNEVDKILVEATANENWNIANSKLQTLADACFQGQECSKIVEHLKAKLDSPPFEWRRILKVCYLDSDVFCLVSQRN